MRASYVRLRKRIPAGLVEKFRRNKWLLMFVRRVQPRHEELVRLEAPLAGFRMVVPQAWVYPMGWGTYEPGVCNAILNNVMLGMRVLDIGAHIGYISLLLARQVGPEGEVIAFEPLPENRRLLSHNLAINDLEMRVRIEPMAVADRISLMQLRGGSSTAEGSLIRGGDDGLIIPVCSLDAYFALLDWPHVDFIKMDIEGAESLAIQGMIELIRRNHPAILLEAHGEVARSGLETLSSLGYRLWRVTELGKPVSGDLSQPINLEHWLALQTGTVEISARTTGDKAKPLSTPNQQSSSAYDE